MEIGNMKMSFAIHGTPGKSECWGMPNSEIYLKSYYDEVKNASEQTRLDIDFRVVDDTVCSFYHYLKLKNISNGIARSGGYFGMSIRFEGTYCLDVSNLFLMLDQLYERVVCKSILKTDGTNVEYVFSSFKQCQAELENVKALATKNLDKFKNDIKEFPQNYTPKHSDNIEIYNIQDTGSESFINVLFRDAEVYVSPEYPLLSSKIVFLNKDNKEKNEQIKEQQGIITNQKGKIASQNTTINEQVQAMNKQNTIIGQQASEITQKNQQLEILENKLESANRTIGKLNKENTNLEKKLQDALSDKDIQEVNKCVSLLYSVLENRKKSALMITSIDTNQKQLAGDIDKTRQDILKIQNDLKAIKSPDSTDPIYNNSVHRDDNIPHSGFNWKTPVSLIALVASLSIIYFLVFGPATSYDDFDDTISNPDNKEFAEFKKDVENRLKQIDIQMSTLINHNNSVASTIQKTNEHPKITRINLRGGSSVKIGLEYIFEAYSGDKVADCGGSFSCSSNATIIENSGKTCKVKVNDFGNDGLLQIKYSGNGTSSRNITVSK